jgi:hypothetical protein
MDNEFRLLMLGAMYENGGNVTHRLFDGHTEMFVYPFESQLGTRLVADQLSSVFPVKYRWPVFALDATPEDDYRAIIDEECKVRARTPQVSKFRHVDFDFSDEDRLESYLRYVAREGRSRPTNVASFFRSTFEAWKDHRSSGRETWYVGYSPIIVIDAARVLDELPEAHFLHVVRNPWSAYADTKKRPVPLSLREYMLGWTLNQYHALIFKERYSDRFDILRIEDVMSDPLAALSPICERLGIQPSDALRAPSWNGTPLDEVYPWGTIRRPTGDANRATAAELSRREQDEIRALAGPYLELLDYGDFFSPDCAGRDSALSEAS